MAANHELELYVMTGCPYCIKVKNHFITFKRPYTELVEIFPVVCKLIEQNCPAFWLRIV